MSHVGHRRSRVSDITVLASIQVISAFAATTAGIGSTFRSTLAVPLSRAPAVTVAVSMMTEGWNSMKSRAGPGGIRQ